MARSFAKRVGCGARWKNRSSSVSSSTLAAAFSHGNVAIPASLDKILRHVVVTPDMHRVHHSLIHLESNHNFGNLFPWWDHLFLTYQAQPRAGHERMDVGIAEIRTVNDARFWKLLVLPFISSRARRSALPHGRT
jgi:sterol desaturase/sphingolipid hydroxylase (fatty acid hydroxylase superfamily)